MFGDEKRRRINLGGTSSTVSHGNVLQDAKTRRIERDRLKRQNDAATRVQAAWRATAARSRLKERLRPTVQSGGLAALRALVLVGDAPMLADWAACTTPDMLWQSITGAGPDQKRWIVLLRQVLVRIIQTVSTSPQDSNALPLLRLLLALLDPAAASRALGDQQGREVCLGNMAYLLARDYYLLLGRAIRLIPVASKSALTLPALVDLSTLPLQIFPANSSHQSSSGALDARSQIVELVVLHILTIPLLPNRLPISSLTALSARLPLNDLHLMSHASIDEVNQFNAVDSPVASITRENSLHLLANLSTFAPPRYSRLSAPSLAAYLSLMAALLRSLPSGALDFDGTRPAPTDHASSFDSDDDDYTSELHSLTRQQTLALHPLDPRTLKRLAALSSADHIGSLLLAPASSSESTRGPLWRFLAGILGVCSPTTASASAGASASGSLGAGARRDGVLHALSAWKEGGLVRELWRGWARTASVGKEGILLDASKNSPPADQQAREWPALVVLAEVYGQALLTMGDDEFFADQYSTSTARSGIRLGGGIVHSANVKTTAARNPLTLDDLASFSRILLNIAFSLYWRGDQDVLEAQNVPGLGIAWTWSLLRERLTRCLNAIHARDSRRSFTPPSHWLILSDTDVTTFIEAALSDSPSTSHSVFVTSPQPPMHIVNPIANMINLLNAEDSSTPNFPTGVGSRAVKGHSRQRGTLSPQLGVLNNIPFALAFDARVSVFRAFVHADLRRHELDHGSRANMDWEDVVGAPRRNATRVTIRRDQIASDGFDRLANADLRKPVQITFIDQFGQEEAGIDGGGVFKEFFTSLCKEAFDANRGLWLVNKKNELYPNPHSYATEAHSLEWYRFVGRFLGKAMYDGILVDVAFAGFFLAKWLGKQSFLDDLSSLDPELYQGLTYLKHSTENPEDLALNFTIAVEEFGVTKSVDLIPNGSNIAVTRENKLQYIYLVSHFRLSKQIKEQSDAFFAGLSEMIDPKWLRMFNQQEVQILISGVNSPVNVEDLRYNTVYGGLFDDAHPTIQAFWRVVNSLNDDEKRGLLRFVTSCSRPPLLGFQELVPHFAIRDAGDDQARLPTSSTCVNLLKLPRYTSEARMRAKLLQAINANAGFDLS